MDLFIDTNIFLSFYHLTSDDLEELRKLLMLIDDGAVKLHLPEQVVNEFRRNRDSRLADALKRFKKASLKTEFPQICKEYDQYPKMMASIKAYNQAKNELIEQIEQAIKDEDLGADKVITDLFKKAQRINNTEKILNHARLRFDLGNPPGKKSSYGDAINWESLLISVPDGEDIFFVTSDKDYMSNLNNNDFSPFLLNEWKKQKNSGLHFFKRLSAFFEEHFPDIKLASELEKELLIKKLANSPTFANTRTTLKRLSRFGDFTRDEARSVVSAAIGNNQVYWIMTDADINSYLRKIITGHEEGIDEDDLSQFQDYLRGEPEPAPSPEPSIEDYDIPF